MRGLDEQTTAHRVDRVHEHLANEVVLLRVSGLRNARHPRIPLSSLVDVIVEEADVAVVVRETATQVNKQLNAGEVLVGSVVWSAHAVERVARRSLKPRRSLSSSRPPYVHIMQNR